MHEQRKSPDWHVLCELASQEQDPIKLLDLVRRLNEALDHRLRDKPPTNQQRFEMPAPVNG